MITDSMEIAKKAYSKDIPSGIIAEMVLLKLPVFIQILAPFAILLGGILTFSHLMYNSELIVMRASGVSAWQFLTPAVTVSFIIGIFIITVFNSVSAVMFSRYEHLEARYFREGTGALSVSSTGLWLKQYTANGKAIIHAAHISHDNITLSGVSIFVFGGDNNLIKRIEAKTVQLMKNYWEVRDALIAFPADNAHHVEKYEMKTNLSPEQIREGFVAPETISLWELPGFIKILQNAGFSTLKYSVHLHRMLVMPFFFSAMVFFSAVFALKLPRNGKTGILISAGIIAGFIVHFFSNLIAAFALSGSISAIVAAWIPVLIIIAVGFIAILHFEDG